MKSYLIWLSIGVWGLLAGIQIQAALAGGSVVPLLLAIESGLVGYRCMFRRPAAPTPTPGTGDCGLALHVSSADHAGRSYQHGGKFAGSFGPAGHFVGARDLGPSIWNRASRSWPG